MTTLREAFQALLSVLDRLEIPYLVGGSIASSTHGLPRQTNDVDILADLSPSLVPLFCEGLKPAFWADAEMIHRAIAERRSFNLIHMAAAYKFDIFPAGGDDFARSQLQRRLFVASTISGLEDIEFAVASPEDTLLTKLVWFRRGGEMSDRQWHDLLGVANVQRARLDREYLDHWAQRLEVADLLQKLF